MDYRKLTIVSAVVSAALLGGCGAISPLGAPQKLFAPSSHGAALHPDRRGSWMLPGAKGGDLLYISDEGNGDVYVFSYPKSKLVGTLSGLGEPQGECTDKKGDIFVTTFEQYQILEYAHGGTTRIATLDNPNEYMEGCSVDPTTGNLAVINFETSSNGPGGVSIFKKAKGTPKVYSDSSLLLGYAIGYDGAGNIFLDGLDDSRAFEFAELPKGSAKFKEISLGVSIANPGGVEWDGKYVAVGDEKAGIIYQTNGAGGKIEGSTTLSDSNGVFQFVIAGKTVVGPNVYAANAMFWKYPLGGKPTKTLTGMLDPEGAALSL